MHTELPTLPAPAIERLGVERSFAIWRVIPFLALWLMACWGLADHWRLNPQYHYGWFVPALALFSAYERWQARPTPGCSVRAGLWVASILCLLLFPAWLVLQPSSGWPLVHWAFVSQICAIILCTIAAVGGWRWVRHFSFPVLLIFTAVPWPDQLESPLMQFLMRTVATVAVTGLDILGVTAIQHGNLLEVAGGVVGVNEACSGIRSLQGSLAASLVLGETFRFEFSRRLQLVVLSVVVAFLTNVIRVGFLAWCAARSGVASVDHWHDPAGTSILLVCVAAILGVALLLDRGTIRKAEASHRSSANPLPWWFAPSLAVCVGVTIVGTELWYYDRAKPPQPPWAVVLPVANKPLPVPPAAWAQLRYDTGIGAEWSEAGGRRWFLYFFDWEYGPTFSRVAAQNHRPDICLPATGLKLETDRGKLSFAVEGFALPFHGYAFRQGKERLFVYHGIWPFRSERGQRRGSLAEGKHMASLQSVLWREREIGQQAAELIVRGCTDAAEADAAFSRLLPEILRRRDVPFVPNP